MYWSHYKIVEYIQGLIQVINLWAHADNKAQQQNPARARRSPGDNSSIAMPKPFTQETENAPITESMVIYTRTFICPWQTPTTEINIQGHNDHECCKDHKT